MKFIGDFELLSALGFNVNFNYTYYFKSYEEHNGVFIDIETRKITNLGSDDSKEFQKIIATIENYIEK